jgi:hypothetical protein
MHSQPASESIFITTREHLSRIRGSTCYSALRIVILIAFVLLYIGIALQVAFAFMMLFQVVSNPALNTPLPWATGLPFVWLAGSIVLLVVTIAIHQAVLLGVDIADSVIFTSALITSREASHADLVR